MSGLRASSFRLQGWRSAGLALVGLLGLVAGCEGSTAWPPEPAPIALGEDACSSCKMIVSDGRFAAELRTRAGGVEVFDDLGCLVERWRSAPPEMDGVFVGDHATGAWVRGGDAAIVRAKDIPSPMGYGLAAFATRAAADGEAARHKDAKVLNLSELLREKS